MNQVVTIGLDIAKPVFQLHGVASAGAVVVRKRPTRSQMLPFFERQAFRAVREGHGNRLAATNRLPVRALKG